MKDKNMNAGNSVSVFHQGEHIAQTRVGMRDKLEEMGKRFIRPYFLDQHRDFFAQLPFVVISACDEKGLPWVSLLAAKPGFITSVDDQHLHFAAQPVAGDALASSLATSPVNGTQVGVIGIELHSRRRNRANGVLTQVSDSSLLFKVSQSYGNCPQYITPRQWRQVETNQGATVEHHLQLNEITQQWISQADTLFIASNSAIDSADIGSMDASHRGGEPGFVTVINQSELVLPDYRGNNFFNTIGNLILNPKIGLLFIDFATGSMLQITGRAVLDWESDDIKQYPGAQRLIRIEIDQVIQLNNALSLRWR